MSLSRYHKSLLNVSVIGVCVLLQACTTTSSGGTATSTAVDKAIGKCVGSVALSTISGALIGSAISGSSGAKRGAVAGAVVGLGACAVLIELAQQEDKRQLRNAQLAALEVDQTTTSSFVTQSGKTAKVTTQVTPAPALVKKKAPAKPAKPKKVKVEQPVTPKPQVASDISTQPLPQESQPELEVVEAKPVINETQEPEKVAELAFVEEKPSTIECRFTSLKIDMDGGVAETDKQKWCKSNDGSWEPVTG